MILKVNKGYRYNFEIKNAGKEIVNVFEIIYSGDVPVENSQPQDWGYTVQEMKDKDGNVLQDKKGVSCQWRLFLPDQGRRFFGDAPDGYFEVGVSRPRQSLSIE